MTLICKRAAIKGNSPLSMAEMQELVRRLEGCRSPHTCPHGRPTMVYLSSGELARQFGRVSRVLLLIEYGHQIRTGDGRLISVRKSGAASESVAE